MSTTTLAVDVVHVVCTDAFAGVERYVTTLARTQDARGLRVHVLGGAADRMPAELAGSGVRWAPAPTPWRAAAALRRLDARLVHAHMTAAELASVASTRAPVVATRHFAATRGSSPVGRAVGRYVAPRLAAQVAISAFVADRVEGPSTVVHPGVPTVERRGTEAGRRRVVLMAQRLEAEKRTDVALRMWAASGLAAEGWELHLAGDGALRPELEALARELGVDGSVRFLGRRADMPALLASVGIFFAPRGDEPYGLSVVEAMAHGTPVVAGRGGGHSETVGTADGAVLVPPDDVEAAGAALARLAHDPARRAAYGEELRAVQQRRFGPDAHADGIAAVYAAVLGAPLAPAAGAAR
ncbi:glycosyltransferase family 4 protein [Cellulomonas pakistanensis]|uniref:Glycosyl transferase family 1 n=1 Tax=Cellulomonas pakistanensis TaxID=992287 RepID=A0A919PEB5_9CELL|nr:glycosyltransferase family 4 protein [Cellulomonas pakistanensis]GIG36602.1 glycosyl transferase family 1 [Cellulomonas pakistanensis]